MASSSIPVEGRLPGPPRTTTAPASSNSAASPGPAATATIGRGRPAARLAGGDLLGEVGDPHPVRPAGLDPGLDGGADVVDVDVDVPEPLAADDDEGVAEPGEGAAQRARSRRRRRRGGTSPRTPGRRPPGPRRARPATGCGIRRPGSTGGGRLPVSAVSAASRITTTPRPPASTTPASREHLELLGRAGQRLAGRGGAGGEHVARAHLRVALEQLRGGLRRRPGRP